MSSNSFFGFVLAAAFGIASVLPSLADEECKAPATWFPAINKAQVDALFQKRPAGDAECDFYQWAYATFLYLTQSDSGQPPRFVPYKSFNQLFGKPISISTAAPKSNLLNLTPRVVKQATSVNDFDGVAQAGLSGVLVDQAGTPIYYAMHFNEDFVNFMTSNGFLDKTKLKQVAPDKSFPTGALELKSAWRIKPDTISEADFRKSYLSTDVQVPGLKEVTDAHGKKTVVADPGNPVQKIAGLVGLHVVGVINGHPEFVWGSFEHRGNAPNGKFNASPSSLDPVDPNADWLLYKKGTSYRAANPLPGTFDFSLGADGKVTPSTSVYRVFPSGGKDGTSDEDDQVTDLNGSVQGQLDASSVLRNYKLIGTVWLEKGDGAFGPDLDFPDDLLAGEKQLSNMSMESFTQSKKPNCFSCHFTHGQGDMPASNLNVSHAILKFVDGK